MGADYYPITVIGIRVPNEKIMINKEMPPENHCRCIPQTDPNKCLDAKYCPHCGNILRKTRWKLVSRFEGIKTYDNVSKLLGWPVVNDTNEKDFFIGVYSSGLVDYQQRDDIPDLFKEVLDKFRKDMESIGLWDEKEFGIWTVLCIY